MESRLTFSYDAVGDILYVNFVPPYREQESDMIADGVVARTNPGTGRVENLEILWFMRTFGSGQTIDLPIDPDLFPRLRDVAHGTSAPARGRAAS